MLSPDALQDAGDAVAALYSDMEAKMLDHLVGALISEGRLSQKSMTELNLLAQSMTPDLRRIIDENREAIADEVYETCEKLLSASDRDDAKRLNVNDVTFPRQLAATVVGLQQVLDRDNLKMVEGAKQAFLKASMEAVTMTNSGLYTSEQAIHRAVRNLTTGGISVTEVTYQNPKTGAVTVTNKVDVAVRRHVRTQIAQDSGRMTLERLMGMDVALVEVSSHEGSRPSHAEWQGRCYSLKGEVVIEGKRYPDFYSATGYGSVDGLLGANCRHSFGPYRHGAPRSYQPDPKHPSGLSNDEVYKLTQKQRYHERQVRAAKRDVMGAQRIYEKDASLSNRTNLLQAQQRLKNRQAAMRTFIKDANAKCKPDTTVLHRNPRREWAGDMPKSVKVNASQRTLNEFVKSKAAQLKKAGISQTRFKAELSGELAKRGGSAKDWPALAAREQQNISAQIFKRKTLLPVEERRKNLKPANPAFVKARIKEIERAGGTVWMDDEATRYLNVRGADAATLGDVIALRQDATLSEILEEEFHFHQYKRDDYAECNDDELLLRREIDAQRYLLDVSTRYKIPRMEAEQTKAALKGYQEKLDELLNEGN